MSLLVTKIWSVWAAVGVVSGDQAQVHSKWKQEMLHFVKSIDVAFGDACVWNVEGLKAGRLPSFFPFLSTGFTSIGSNSCKSWYECWVLILVRHRHNPNSKQWVVKNIKLRLAPFRWAPSLLTVLCKGEALYQSTWSFAPRTDFYWSYRRWLFNAIIYKCNLQKCWGQDN